MANSKMKLELLLKGVDQLSGVVKKQSPLLKNLSKDATKAYQSLKKLFSLSPKNNFSSFGKQSSSAFSKANFEALKFKKTVESIGKVKMPKINAPSFDGSPKINLKQGQKELDKFYNSRQTPNKYVDRLAKLNDRVFEPATQIKNAWREQYDSLKQYTDEASKLLRLQGRFEQMNLGEADNRKMFAAVEQNTKNVRGISLSDSMDIASNIYNALNNVDATIASLGTASKYQVAMSSLYSDKFSPEQINDQVLQGYKFVELTGKTKDRETMESRFNVLSKVVSSTGGEVTMAKFLGMGKQASPIMQTVTDKGVMNTAAAIDTMGGERVGTALSALNRAWVRGVMPGYIAERYSKLGLIKEGGLEYNQAGKLTRVKPGANVLGDAFLQDPLEATKLLTKAIHEYAATPEGKKDYKDFDLSTPKGMNQVMGGLFGTETQYRLANEFINNLSQVEKESSRAEKSEGAIDTYDRLDKKNHPLLKFKEYEAAVKNFRTEAGKPLIEVGTKLAAAITPLLQLAAEHPTVTQFALATILVSKGINGIGQTASILNSAGGGLTSFFKNSTTAANNTATAIGGVNSKLSALKTGGTIALRVGAIVGLAYAVDKAIESYRAAQEAKKGKDSAISANTGVYNNAMADKDISSEEKLKLIKSEASTNFGKLNTSGLLRALGVKQGTTFSQKGRTSDWYTDQLSSTPGAYSLFGMNNYRNIWGGFDRNLGVEKFRKDAPTLSHPDVMREFLKYLPQRIPGQDAQSVKAREEITKTAQTAFPDSFSIAMRELAGLSFAPLSQGFLDVGQSMTNLQQPTSELGTGLSNLNQNSTNAVTGVGNLATATSGAAARINALQITPPSFAPIQIPVFGQNPNPTFGGIPGRARGGSVSKGHFYRINEQGQEIFAPNQNGNIIPNDVLRSRRNAVAAPSNVTMTVHVNVTSSDNPRETAKEIRRELAALLRDVRAEMNPRNVARKVAVEVERDAGRI